MASVGSRKRGFLFPVRALSKVFRGKYLGAVSQALRGELLRRANHNAPQPKAFAQLLAEVRERYSKRPFAGPEQVVAYRGRYSHRIAISNERLLASSRERSSSGGTTPLAIRSKR